jgi:hypothetical protein
MSATPRAGVLPSPTTSYEIAWMWAREDGRPDAAGTEAALRDIRVGLYETGRVIGISDRKLEELSVLDDEVRRRRKELKGG